MSFGLVLVLWFVVLRTIFPQSTESSLRVLFIGNSYTYFNNLPEMVEQLAASAREGPRIEARMVGVGGATLERHWQMKLAQQAIQIGRWDFVVLQEQSTLGASPLIDGLPTIRSPDNFFKYARMFNETIRQAGAQSVFFSTWARRGAPKQNQHALDFAYMHIAKELKARIAPVGLTWQAVQASNPDFDLYGQDGSHPSPVGTYLSACVFYAVLTGRSPEGLTAKVFGPPVDDAGRVTAGQKVRLVDLPVSSTRQIQHAAWKAYRRLKAAGGYLDVPAPPESTRP